MEGTPPAVEAVRSDERDQFKGDLANLCMRHSICQEFTFADSANFNGVAEHHMMVESAGLATRVQEASVW